MPKVYQFTKNGGIDYRDESVPENGYYPQGSDRFNEIMASGVEILPYQKNQDEAIELGLLFINQYFNEWQQKDLMVLLITGNELQKNKINSIYEWMKQLKIQALTDPVNFNPSGDPPYTYIEVIST